MATILIVEDEVLLLTLIESVLQDAGYETISAGTVNDARTIIINSKQRVDLIFTDIGLPNQSDGGVTVGRLAGQVRPGIPVLYTSGQQPVDEIKSRFVERSGFLQKPYRDEDLVQAVAVLFC
jgi:DNA-binding NtrC family response regulator